MGRFGLIRILAFWLAISVTLQAQQYVFRTFRQAEGLDNLKTDSLATDRAGFLWMGTENGVYRFIGSGFERYGAEQGIAEPNVLDVISDPNGTIWASTKENLYRWNGQRFLPAGQYPIRVEGPRRIAVEDAGHLLVVERGHLYRLEHDAEGRMISYLPLFPDHMLASMPDLGKVLSLSVVHDPHNGGRVWAGCGSGLCSWHGGEAGDPAPSHNAMMTEWGKDEGLAADRWAGVLLDHAGTLWVAGATHVAVLPAGSAHFFDRSIPGNNLQGLYSHAPLIEDREGRILAPTGEGIARWNGTAWQIIDQDNGLEQADHIVGMAFDAAGDLWMASRGDGLYQWTGYADWEGWGYQQGLPSASIRAIGASDPHRIFVGTERGPAWIDPRSGTATEITALWRWPWGQVRGIGAERNGFLTVVTLSGNILRLNSKTGDAVETAKMAEPVSRAVEDSFGRLFLETAQGLYLSEPASSSSREGKAVLRRTAPHRVPAADALTGGSGQVAASCESPDGTDWFGIGARLLRLRSGQWSAPAIDGMPKQSGLLYALSCAQDGAVWMVVAPGLTWRLTMRGDRLQAWQLAPPPELRGPVPVAILADRRGWVWLGTDRGLLVWNGQSWRHLTQESGLIWNDVNRGVMQEAPDGSLWIGTGGGVSHLLHPERAFEVIPLTVVLMRIRQGETSYLEGRKVIMSSSDPPLHIQVASPAMRNRRELSVKIRMVGLQSEWMETHDGNATFARLPPGKFTFMAMVCNPSLNACSVPVKVAINVLPPWWRTNWFYVFCILVFLSLLAISNHLYTRHLRARSRQLEMLVHERTGELEAGREQLRLQATHDGLTGMLNRGAILQTLTAEMDRALRESGTFVVALVDLDHFKLINDDYGHLAGDEALRWFAAAVRAAIRPYDHVGRYGGEEFLFVLTEVPREAIEQRLASLQASISNMQVSADGVQFTLNCSMGATIFDSLDRSATVESLLAIADQSLYAAKAAGRDCFVFRPPGQWYPLEGERQEASGQFVNL